MLIRCYDLKNHNYANYGGRGIQVCDQWRIDFLNFLYDMGERPDGCTLDRIDVNGDYCPSNCRWATIEQQNKNKRRKYHLDELYQIPRELLLNALATQDVDSQ
jgi:hypothetical protein